MTVGDNHFPSIRFIGVVVVASLPQPLVWMVWTGIIPGEMVKTAVVAVLHTFIDPMSP